MPKCILPWISIESTPTGGARPCCLSNEQIPNINLKKNTLNDAFHSPYMNNLRQQFIENKKPKTCTNCWTEEQYGKKSKRQYMLEKFKDVEVDYTSSIPKKLLFLDLKLGNICNLKCRICGSWSSSKWAAEELTYVKDSTNHIARTWLKEGRWPRESKVFWESIEEILPHVKYFEFTGGEPMLIKEHFDLLQIAVDKNFAKDIDIHYNTNTTKLPLDTSIWKNFKHIQIAFSVDNTEERFEYERYGAKWKIANKNIEQVHKLRDDNNYNITTQLCATWNVQNIFYLDEVLVWANTMNFNSIHFNLMHDPWEFSLAKIPIISKNSIINYLKKLQLKHKKYSHNIAGLQDLVASSKQSNTEPLFTKLRQTDLYRNQNFATTHFKMAKVLGYVL